MNDFLTLEVPRNGHYQQDWQLSDIDDVPIDLTGSTIKIDIRAVAGQGAVLASALIDIYEPEQGQFTVTIAGSSLASVPGTSEIVRLAYDMRQIFPDGIVQVYPRGHVKLIPGVTF